MNSPIGVHDAIRAHLLAPLGPIDPEGSRPSLFVDTYLTQLRRYGEFFQFLLNRLVMGHYRYERDLKKLPPRIEGILERLDSYRASGNREYLLDIANFCALEYTYPTHPEANFASVERDHTL